MQDAAESSESTAQHESVSSRAEPPWQAVLRFLGITTDLPRGRAVRWAGAAVGFCAAFVLLKLWLLVTVGAQVSQLLRDLPFDVLAATAIGVVAVLSLRGARILFDLLLIYCWLSMLYAMLYGSFADLAVWRYRDEAPTLVPSFLAILTWSNVLLLPGLWLVHRFVSARVMVLTKTWPRSAGIGLLVCLAVLGLTAELPGSQLPGPCRGNPLTALLARHDRSTLPIEQAPPTSLHVSAPVARQFSPVSQYTEPKPPPAPPQTRIERPNVVILLLESTGRVAMQRPGSSTTPFLDRLAANGIDFTRFYAFAPRSLKTIFSLHTGWYPLVSNSLITEVNPRLPCKTLAEFFKECGYRTVLLHGGFFRYTNKLNFLRGRGYDDFFDARSLPGAKERMLSKWGCDDAVVYQHALRWIESGQGPFLMVIIPILPHHPYNLPKGTAKPYPEKTSLDRYHNSLRYQDALIESFADGLKRDGLFENTIFVVTGDHGEAFGQHIGSYIHGHSVHEESVSVPLVISNPVLFPKARVSDVPGQFSDLLPTILDVCGFEAGGYCGDGVSLFAKQGNEMSFFFQDVSRLILGLRDGNTKYIWHVETGLEELYDLQADPGEKHNVVHQHANRADYYRQTLNRWKRYADGRILQPALPTGRYEAIDLTSLMPAFGAQDWGDFNYGASVEGNPFKLGGKVYPTRGIGTHANSILEYDISKIAPARFTALVGRDSRFPKHRHSSARFQIRVDWQVVYDSGIIDATDGAVPVDVGLPKGNTLSLLTFKADDGGQGDHCDWIEPTLHYAQPPE